MVFSNSEAQSYFHDVADSVGIQFTYGDGLFGGGVSFYDFNGDGWDDITMASEKSEEIAFYQNMGGTFQLIDPPFVSNISEKKQVLWVDFDNDGDKDLFVTGRHIINQSTSIHRNRLYLNDGNMNFTDVTVAAGISIAPAPTFGATFGDINKDGYLDLLILNRAGSTSPYPNQLYLNNGNGTFTDVSQSSGIVQDTTLIFCAAFFDMENDLDQDIYMAADKYFNNRLLENQGNGTFQEVGPAAGADIAMDAMNVGVGDYNNDGYLDLYVTNTHIGANPGNKLLKNNGNGTFTEVSYNAGVEYLNVGWGANWFDADNDMDLDLYCSGTWPVYPPTPSVCYENLGNGTFSTQNTMGFIGDTTASYSNAIGDFNNDGYPDIAVNNEAPDSMQLWMNQTGSNHWLKVSLQGTISNRDGIGSFIEVFVSGNKYIRYTHCGIAYLAQNSGTEIFGLGANTIVDSLKVRWLSGLVDVLYDVDVDQKVQIIEGSTTEKIKVEAKVFLEGPYDDNSGLMDDGLRIAGLLPSNEPFTNLGFVHVHGGDETVDAGVFNITGNDAIVDWVFLELRDKGDNTNVVYTRSALLQRDGDVVDMDGVLPVEFLLPEDDYFVVVRHRNHLGVMGNSAIALGTTPTSIDLSNGSVLTFGSNAQKDINGTLCLWSGNVIPDDQLKYTGLNNDRDPILIAIGGAVPTASITGYYSEDTTLDGVVKYTGLNNDRDVILVNIGGLVPTAVRVEQLP